MDIIYNANPRLSAEARIQDLSYELRCSQAFVAALGKINPTVLSNALRGVKTLPNETASELLATLTFLIQLVEAARPFTIPLSNAAETRELIFSLQKRGVTPDSVRAGISKITQGTDQ